MQTNTVTARIRNWQLTTKVAVIIFFAATFIALIGFAFTKLIVVLYIPILAVPFFYYSNKLILQSYLLFAFLAFSKNIGISVLSLDVPDELFMLINTATIIVFCIINKGVLLKPLLKDALFTMFLLSFLYLFMNIFWSQNPVLSIKYFAAKFWYFVPFGLGVFIFQQVNKNFISNVIALLSYSAALSVFIILGYHTFLGLKFETVNEACSLLYLNHVTYGSFIAIVLPISYYHLRYNSIFNKFKKLNVAVLIILFLGLIQSYCRSAWLAVLIAVIAVWLFYNKILFKAALASIAIVVIFLFWLLNNANFLLFKNNFSKTEFHADFDKHWAATFNGKDVSNAERFYRWGAGMRMGVDYFPLGSGSNTFYPIYKKYTINAFKTWVSANEEHSTVHNFYLLLFIEQGFFGLALFVGLVLLLLYQLQYIGLVHMHKKMAAMLVAMMGVILMQLTSSDMLESDKVGPFFYFIFAIWWLIKNDFINTANNKKTLE